MTLTPDYYHNSRSFNLLATSDAAEFMQAVQDMLTLLGLKDSKLTRAHMLALLVNLTRMEKYRPGHYIRYSRNNNEWTKVGTHSARLYNPFGLSRKLVEVVDAMAAQGLLEHVVGFHARQEGCKRWAVQSRMKATPELGDFMENHGLLDIETHLEQKMPLVRLRDKDGDLLYRAMDKRVPHEIQQSQRFIKEYNDFIAEQELNIDADGHGCFLDETMVYRVFNYSSWQLGGRFAGAWWMNCGKEYRHLIHINGEPTVELDYSAQHINLLYALRGISLPREDPYAIQGLDRAFIKAVCLRLVNAVDVEQAWKSCKSEGLRDMLAGKATALAHEVDGCLFTLDDFEELVETIQDNHKPIAGDLCAGKGLELMHWDSIICQCVLQIMTTQGIPCLSVHDSFLVPASSKETLRSTMVEAYYKVGLGKYVPIIK